MGDQDGLLCDYDDRPARVVRLSDVERERDRYRRALEDIVECRGGHARDVAAEALGGDRTAKATDKP